MNYKAVSSLHDGRISSTLVMPFMRIDFSSYDVSDIMQKTLREQFTRFFRPVHFVLSILCCRIEYLKPKGSARIVIERCHTAFLVILFIAILTVIILQVRLHLQLGTFNLRASSSLVSSSIFQAQGFANLLFLVFWDRQRIADTLHQSLMSNSTGVGVLRRRAVLNNIHVGAMLSGCVLSLLFVCYSVMQLFTNHLPNSPIHSSSIHPYLKWAFLGVFVYLSISFPAAYAQFASLISIITAEYKALNDDFVDDVNTYQLPVAKHYVSAHWKLGNTFNIFKRSLSMWISIHLITSFVSLLIIWMSVPPLRNFIQTFDHRNFERAFETSFASLLFMISIIQIVILLVACLALRFYLTRMRYSMITLLASDKTLHEQTYSLAIAYINHLHRRRIGITFLEIVPIDRQFIVEVAIIMTIMAAILYS